MKKILTLLFVLFSATGFSQVVISQIYSGGGSGSAYFNFDYIELHNMGNTTAEIGGFVIQYGSKTGTPAGTAAIPANKSIPAGGYYLIQMNTSAGAGFQESIPTPDLVLSPAINMGADNGKILIKNGTETVDFVAYGTGTTTITGYVNPIPAFSKSKVGVRNLKGNIDSKDNAADFEVLSSGVIPRTSSTMPFRKSDLNKVVMSQVYPGGGNASSYYKNAYIEMKNIGDADLDISGFSIQYGTGTGDLGGSGSNYVYVFPTGTVLTSGKYLLIQTGKAAGASGNDIPTPDLIMGGDTISTTGSPSGKLAVTGTSTKLGCGSDATPCGVNPQLLDFVAWNATTLTLSNDAKGLVRKDGGCKNTMDYTVDFEVVTNPTPRNGSTPAALCTPPSPVQLISFSAVKVGSAVQLKWNVAQEQNTKEYVVERSNDQSSWSAVSSVAASGNNSYGAEDRSPAQGTNYYRLKMVDADGSFTYSDIKSVVNANGFAVSISPNPASTFINVTLSGNNGPSRVMMSDMNGKMVYNEMTNEPKVQINSSSFAKGMYIIKVINGNETLVNKVIVQ